MVNNGYSTAPNHRQNRRRERPGSRTRRIMTRKLSVQFDYSEGILDALDYDVQLPSNNTRPSPLLRQNFDQSWQRWKTREAEEKALALAEMQRVQLELEQEHLKLFGGDIDDDELFRRGILYHQDPRTDANLISTSVSKPIPSPMYIIRQVKPRRSHRRRPVWQSIPRNLSLSNLRDDNDIARLLSPPPPTTEIQHRPSPVTAPLSLPNSYAPALSFPSAHGSELHFLPTSLSPHSLELEDWTFITAHLTPSDILPSPAASEPETWILLSDDLQQIDSH